MENQKLQPFINLTIDKRKSLQKISERDDIVILKVDKSDTLFIIDVKDYIGKAESQLKQKDDYNRVKNGPKETYNKLVNCTIERYKKQKTMKEKVPAGLKTENPRTPKFYLQPRKLKKRNLGCPVVGSVNCHNSNISMYIVSFTTYC